MSKENVEIMRRAYAAFNRGDIDGMVADVAPDFVPPAGVIPGVMGVYRGPEGLKVLATETVQGRGKQSGAESSWTLWELWTARDGKLVHGQGITSRDEALKAAGLSE